MSRTLSVCLSVAVRYFYPKGLISSVSSMGLHLTTLKLIEIIRTSRSRGNSVIFKITINSDFAHAYFISKKIETVVVLRDVMLHPAPYTLHC